MLCVFIHLAVLYFNAYMHLIFVIVCIFPLFWVITSYQIRDEYKILAALFRTGCRLISITPEVGGVAHRLPLCPPVDVKWQVRNTILSLRPLWLWTVIEHICAQWCASSDRGQSLTSLSACQAVFTRRRWKQARVKADSYLLICCLVVGKSCHIFRLAAWGHFSPSNLWGQSDMWFVFLNPDAAASLFYIIPHCLFITLDSRPAFAPTIASNSF